MVGVMGSEVTNDIAIPRERLLKLMDDKQKLETEITLQYAILQEQNGVGMDEPLVDSNGYPRNDIDVYRVRHARHSVICLKNDLKALMKTIEEGLLSIHMTANSSNAASEFGAKGMDVCNDDYSDLEPIARVKSVIADSPAAESGLLTDDLVIEFGSVNGNNFKSLDDIYRVVLHSVNGTINLMILRGNCKIGIKLCPRQWSGKGVLGCTITPYENNVER